MLKAFLRSYHAKDWIALAIASIVLSVCGVIGASYSKTFLGPSVTPSFTFLFICIGTVAFAVLLLAFNLILDLLAARRSAQSNSLTAEAPSKAPPIEHSSGGHSHQSRFSNILNTITPSWKAKSIALFSVIMLAFWSPWIIAYFPAPLNVDLYHQIYQFFPDAQNYIIPFGGYEHNIPVDAWLVDHHPFFTTILYGSFGWISEQLTGNWEAGIFACSLLHAIGFTVAYSASIAFLKECGCPKGLCLAIWLFFALMPFVVIWSISLTKDSTFTLFFIGCLMMIFNMYRTRGEMLLRPRNIVLFVLCSLALCLTKKTGVYVVIVVSIALAWRFRRKKGEKEASRISANDDAGNLAGENVTGYMGESVTGCAGEKTSTSPYEYAGVQTERDEKLWQRPSIVFLGTGATCAIVMFLLIPFLLFPVLNIHPGGKQEMLGLPFQQTARYIIDHGDEITSEEQLAISRVLDYKELAESYRPRVHDYVKFLYDQEATTQDLIAYLQAYFSMGLKHPETYFDAFMATATFYTSFETPVYITLTSSIDYPRDIAYSDKETTEGDPLVIWSPLEVAGFKDALCSAYYAVCDAPLIGFFLKLALYTTWIPVSLLLYMLRRNIRFKGILLPGLLLLLVCFISPIGATRYTIALFDTIMLIVGMTVSCEHNA